MDQYYSWIAGKPDLFAIAEVTERADFLLHFRFCIWNSAFNLSMLFLWYITKDAPLHVQNRRWWRGKMSSNKILFPDLALPQLWKSKCCSPILKGCKQMSPTSPTSNPYLQSLPVIRCATDAICDKKLYHPLLQRLPPRVHLYFFQRENASL